jgi:hypothetical protein
MQLILAIFSALKAIYQAWERAFLEWWHGLVQRLTRRRQAVKSSVFDEPVPQPKWKPSPRLLKVIRVGLATSVVSAGLVSVWVGWRKMEADPMDVYLPLYEAVGRAAADEAGQVAGYGDRVLVVTYDAAMMETRPMRAEWRAFRSRFGEASRAELAGVERLAGGDEMEMPVLTWAELQRLVKAHERVDVVVSLAGVPVHAGTNRVAWVAGKPKVVAVCLEELGREASAALSNGVVSAVVGVKDQQAMVNAEKPATVEEWRARYVAVRK